MPYSETFIKAQTIMTGMKRYVDNQYSTWKVFLDSYLREFGGDFLTKYNYDVRFLPGISTGKFYKEYLMGAL